MWSTKPRLGQTGFIFKVTPSIHEAWVNQSKSKPNLKGQPESNSSSGPVHRGGPVNDLEFSEVEIPENCLEAFKLKMVRVCQGIKNILLASGFESEKIISGVNSRSGAIVKKAEDNGYGTIVVGRRGFSNIETFFMGRVGHKVVYEGRNFTTWVV